MSREPKYLWGKLNPNWEPNTRPLEFNEEELDNIEEIRKSLEAGEDYISDYIFDISDEEVAFDMRMDIMDKLEDPEWQKESNRLREAWREAQEESEAVKQECKESLDEAYKIADDKSTVFNAANNERADCHVTPEGNVIVTAHDNPVTDNLGDIQLAANIMFTARNDGDTSSITDILKDPNNFEEPFELHNLGIDAINGVTEYTPDEARKLAASIIFEATNNASDEKYDASIKAFLARAEYEAEEDRLAGELREIVGDRGHASYKFEEDSLGNAIAIADTEDGSVEWMNMRNTGIGGSEMLAAMGLKDYVKKDGSISKLNAKDKAQWVSDISAEKAKTFTEEDVADENSGAAARGHAWEPALLAKYQKDNDDVLVAVGKKTWKGQYDFQTINVDGIILNKDTKELEGIVECKNSDKPEKWENGVPVGYKAQVLDYMDATGAKYCDLVARVDGQITTYRIHKDDPMDSTGKKFSDYAPDVEKEWENIKSNVAAIKENGGEDPTGGIQRRVDIPNDWRGVNNSAETMAGLGIGNYESLKAEINSRKKAGETVDSAVRDIISKRFDRNNMGTMVGVDGETAAIVSGDSSFQDPRAFSPLYSNWIETGISRMDSNGNIEEKESILHGADPRILKVNGTGAQDVHGISPEMIAGKSQFRDKETRSKVFKKLMNGDAIVAHNATFEKNHLNAAIPMLKSTAQWVDTAWMGRHFMPDKVNGVRRNGKLETFAEDNGVEYRNAHRAAEDAEMMMKSMNNFLNRENWHIRPEDS